jgi:hypothetical protein
MSVVWEEYRYITTTRFLEHRGRRNLMGFVQTCLMHSEGRLEAVKGLVRIGGEGAPFQDVKGCGVWWECRASEWVFFYSAFTEQEEALVGACLTHA